MSDIYNLLNQVNSEELLSDREEFSELEKEKLFKNIKKEVQKSKKKSWKKQIAVAACMVVVLSGIFFNNSVMAAVEGVFLKLSYELKGTKNLEDYTEVVNRALSDNGYTITLGEVILDNDRLLVSSTIQSEEDITEGCLTECADVYVNGETVSEGAGGSSWVIDDHTIGSVMSYDLSSEVDTSDTLAITLKYYEMITGDETSDKVDIKFEFKANGSKLALGTKNIPINQEVLLPDGTAMTFEELAINDLGTHIYFTTTDQLNYDMELKGIDNNGQKFSFYVSSFQCENGKYKGRADFSPEIDEVLNLDESSSIVFTPYISEQPEETGGSTGEPQKLDSEINIDLSTIDQ